jgi:hypothetical protein
MEIGQVKIGAKIVSIDGRRIGLAESDLHLWDNFSKLAALTIISGYLKSDHISVNASFARKIDIKSLSLFLSYTLNHHIAPKKFNTRVTLAAPAKSGKPDVAGERRLSRVNAILSFSGGLDSTAGLLYARDKGREVLPLWVDFGQRNRRAERESVLHTAKRLKINPILIVKIAFFYAIIYKEINSYEKSPYQNQKVFQNFRPRRNHRRRR